MIVKDDEKMRLNRYLAMCGLASRRKVEEILLEGRVSVNGKIVLLPSLQVEPGKTKVEFDGKEINPEANLYLVMNKPAGYVCAVTDEYNDVILSALPEKYRDSRIFPVGRLDLETEGLLILTNDGDFAHKVMHPSFEITKEYDAMLDRPIDGKALSRWRAGYDIDGHLAKPLELATIDKGDGNAWVRVVIGEGLKREVREMIRLAGFRTLRLIRRKIGKMRLEHLKLGECAEISREELEQKIHDGGTV